MANRTDIVVIGGGAVGLCCALELARSGRSVRLLSRDAIGVSCSLGNSGLVLTSVCGPLAEPGAIAQALRTTRDPDGASRIRPRLDLRFARWAWRFSRCCTREAWKAGLIYTRDLIRAGRPLFEQLAAEASFGYRQAGVLALYRSEEALMAKVPSAKVLGELDIVAQLVDRAGAAKLEPLVTSSVAGGFFYPEDAHLNPGQFLDEMARLARQAGVQIETGAEVTALTTSGSRVSHVEATTGTYAADLVVLAAGAWSPEITRKLRLPLLIEPGKGYSLTRTDGEGGLSRPLRLGEVRTVVTPMGGHLRVTGKLDFVGLNLNLEPDRYQRIPALARQYVKLDGDFGAVSPWCGLRPLTPDGYPLLGIHSAAKNLIVATGHGYLGLVLSTITGRIVTRLAAGEDPGFDLTPMQPDRFERSARSARRIVP